MEPCPTAYKQNIAKNLNRTGANSKEISFCS